MALSLNYHLFFQPFVAPVSVFFVTAIKLKKLFFYNVVVKCLSFNLIFLCSM